MISLLKFVVGMTILATIAAVNEGDGELVKTLAKERLEMREERKEMREEQKEMRADFRRENDEQNRVIAALHKENAAQKEEIKKLHTKLHQADLKMRKTNRQRDVKESKELETKISSAIREERHEMETKISSALREERHSPDMEHVVESVVERSIRRSGENNTNSSLEIELKKLIESVVKRSIYGSGSGNINSSLQIEMKKLIDDQITNYLINNRICVAGVYWHSGSLAVGARDNQKVKKTVSFGVEFPRKPTVSASLRRVDNNGDAWLKMWVNIVSLSTTSATLESYASYGSGADLKVSWLACL